MYREMLRKLILFSCLCLALCMQAIAQKSDFPKSLWLGFKAGVHFSKYQFVPSVPQSQHLGKHAGVSLRLELERGASALIECNYSETGWLERFDDTSLSSERRLRYIEVPFLAQLYLGAKAVRVFVNAGPFVGYCIGDEHRASGASFTEAQTLRQSMPVQNKLAWGLMGGPGLSFAIGKRHRLELETRVAYNFQDVWGNKRTDPYGQSTELRMGAMLAYYFRF